MQVGYVLRFGDQVARAAEQTTRPVTSAGCGDRAHCRRSACRWICELTDATPCRSGLSGVSQSGAEGTGRRSSTSASSMLVPRDLGWENPETDRGTAGWAPMRSRISAGSLSTRLRAGGRQAGGAVIGRGCCRTPRCLACL